MPHGAVADESNGDDRRGAERFSLDAQTTLTLTAGGRDYACRAEDISFGGLRVRFAGEAPRCRDLVLSHKLSGRMAGTMAWHAGSRMGIAFRAPTRKLAHALQCVCVMVAADWPDRHEAPSRPGG